MNNAKNDDAVLCRWERKGEFAIHFTQDVFDESNTLVADVLKRATGSDAPRVLLVADGNVVQRTEGLGTRIGRYVKANGIELAAQPVVMGGGEKIKSDGLRSASEILNAVIDAKVGVNDAILVIGGGTLLDLAGYAAAQVRGGINLVRMPTTIASMIDATFADEAAINTPGVKDALRVPSHCAAAIIDFGFALTVLDGVWRGGVGEAVRFAAVRDAALMKRIAKASEQLKNRDLKAMTAMVRGVVEARAKKGSDGFALWSAGRLEAMSSYKLPHGYAVPIGICIDCAYAVAKGVLKPADQELVCRALSECGALDGLVHSRHLLSQADNILLGLDAWKLSSGSPGIVLPAGLGKQMVDEEPDRELLRQVIRDFLQASIEG